MKTNTFNNIITHDFDFLNIDLEGHDYNVLRTIDFNKFNPKLICVEILKGHNKDYIFDYMKKNNFVLIKNLGPSFFFEKIHAYLKMFFQRRNPFSSIFFPT